MESTEAAEVSFTRAIEDGALIAVTDRKAIPTHRNAPGKTRRNVHVRWIDFRP